MHKTISTPAELLYQLEYAQESLRLIRELKETYSNYYFSKLEIADVSLEQYQHIQQDLTAIGNTLWAQNKALFHDNHADTAPLDQTVLRYFVAQWGTSDLVIDLVDQCVTLLKQLKNQEKRLG
jgi:hypothetical protein